MFQPKSVHPYVLFTILFQTVVLNLRPLVGLASVLETSVIYHLGAKESSTLFRNTLIRDGMSVTQIVY